MRLIFIYIMFFSGVVLAAESKKVNLSIKGTTYNSCTIDIPASLDMGTHQANRWVVNNNYLDSISNPQMIDISFSDCDPYTKINVTAKGTYSSENEWFMLNSLSEKKLLASIQVYDSINSQWTTLHLNERYPVHVITLSDSDNTSIVKLRGLFRRLDNTNSPTGEFKSTVTLFFTFL